MGGSNPVNSLYNRVYHASAGEKTGIHLGNAGSINDHGHNLTSAASGRAARPDAYDLSGRRLKTETLISPP